MITRLWRAILITLAVFAVAVVAQGVETFLTTKEAVVRMVPAAARYSLVRYTLTDEEVHYVRSRWNIELSRQEEYPLFFGWSANDTLVGVMYSGEEMGKHGPIKLAVGLDSRGTVRDLAVMQYQEVRGRPVREDAYLRQYIGKNAESPLKLGEDIRGLTGATFSSRAVTAVTKRAAVLFDVLVVRRGGAAPPTAGSGEGR